MSQQNQKVENIAKEIEGLTLLETSSLVKVLEERLGVSAAPQMMAAAAAAPAAAAEAGEEQTEFTVTLVNGGGTPINVIKEMRTLTSLSLKEAKEAVDGGNFVVKEGVSKADADDIKKKLEAAGATVKIS